MGPGHLLGELERETPSRSSVTSQHVRPKGIGKYDFIARLGSGGMGDVFLAVTHGPNHFRKLCVVKQLRANLPSTARSRQVFSKEGYLAARLNHPNIVQTYEVGEDEGVPFMAMEYLEGQTMRTLFSATRQTAVLPDFSLWVRIVADALAGLQHAHELCDFDTSPLGVIHRDVSPHNIFVTYEGRVCLIDFGAAKLALKRGSVECRTLTGKLGYMAPEYVTGGGIDRRADTFSMGIVLWEALAGKKMPNAGLTPAECCRARPRVSTVERRVDPRLDAIVAKATDVDPERRYESAEEMREALEDWLQTSGRPPRQGDVGDLVTAYFEEERAKVAQAVRRRVEAVPRVHLMGAPSDASMSDLDESALDSDGANDGYGRGPKNGAHDITAQAPVGRVVEAVTPAVRLPEASTALPAASVSAAAPSATRRTLSFLPAMAVIMATVAASVALAAVTGYLGKLP
jgi:serine/threonine protein kinase